MILFIVRCFDTCSSKGFVSLVAEISMSSHANSAGKSVSRAFDSWACNTLASSVRVELALGDGSSKASDR